MVVVKCPVCNENVDLGDEFFEGDIADCDSCGSFLELQRSKDGEWKLVSIEGDWEEEEVAVVPSDKDLWADEEEDVWVEEEEEDDW
jgi:hypothetical protein